MIYRLIIIVYVVVLLKVKIRYLIKLNLFNSNFFYINFLESFNIFCYVCIKIKIGFVGINFRY